jgi:hypothetical protein
VVSGCTDYPETPNSPGNLSHLSSRSGRCREFNVGAETAIAERKNQNAKVVKYLFHFRQASRAIADAYGLLSLQARRIRAEDRRSGA